MQQILKDSLIYILLFIICIVAGVVFTVPKFQPAFDATQEKLELERKSIATKQELENLKFTSGQKIDKVLDGNKKIYEVQGLQFSPEASFAPLFESVVNVAKATGIRIRSIDYNYEPKNDPIATAKLPNYNACELGMSAVGTYTQFQNFFKTLLKEEYLNSISELEMRPFREDKTILVANFKLVLYTKTGSSRPTGAAAPAQSAE